MLFLLDVDDNNLQSRVITLNLNGDFINLWSKSIKMSPGFV